jgi:hypothetical protein
MLVYGDMGPWAEREQGRDPCILSLDYRGSLCIDEWSLHGQLHGIASTLKLQKFLSDRFPIQELLHLPVSHCRMLSQYRCGDILHPTPTELLAYNLAH